MPSVCPRACVSGHSFPRPPSFLVLSPIAVPAIWGVCFCLLHRRYRGPGSLCALVTSTANPNVLPKGFQLACSLQIV